MSKFTPWFDPVKQPPVRKGVYQQRDSMGIAYSKWDGRSWRFVENNIEDAGAATLQSSLMYASGTKWRGLTKPAKG